MGEHDRGSTVWDYIAVYPPGALWEDRLPKALYDGGPVIRVTEETRAAVAQALEQEEARQAAAK